MKKVNDKFVCDICNKEFSKEGWCRQHEAQAHNTKNTVRKDTQENEKNENSKCKLCGHSLRLLNTRNMYEKQAVSAGFEKVCINCDELYY